MLYFLGTASNQLTISPKDGKRPPLGSRPESIIPFQDLRFYQWHHLVTLVPGKKCLSGAVDCLMMDIEATFEKYIWPKSNIMTNAEVDTMGKLSLDIQNEIQNIDVVPPKANFPQWLRAALKSLRADPNIIIAKADKGDSVVILDSDHHHGLTAKHLADYRTYELLETDPSKEIVRRYHQNLERCW